MQINRSAQATAGLTRRRTRARWGARYWPFIVPAVVFYVFVVLVPGIQGAAFSFTNWDGLNPSWAFVGIDNYIRLIGDSQAVRAVFNTLGLAFVTTIAENIIGLLLALALNGKLKSRHILRVVFFAPVVILTVVIAFLWQYIYTPEGPLNSILRGLGLGEITQNWLGDPKIALWSIAVIVIWQFSGYAMIIFLAGLQAVPAEQLEAASIDGAGSWARFWYVVRPLLAPAITVNLMLSLIRGFMIFDQIWVTTQGGPAQSTDSLSTLVYRNAFQYGELGYSAAIAVVLTIFVAVFGIVQYRYVLRSGATK